ncbi:SRPBCC domain-containing protein [Fulvivirga sp. M361]|nr:SRPBCC domain-containing protein [Fulvivirga sp. M361]
MATITTLTAQNGRATTIKKTFNRSTSIGITIKADPAIVWTLLTNASDYSRWNSTIISLEGDIALGEKIHLKSTLDPKRTFKIKVKEFTPEEHMVWGDSKGNRVFTLTQNSDDTVNFHMSEKMGGLMFPLYAKYIPPFDEAFEQFAADLKREAEAIMTTK